MSQETAIKGNITIKEIHGHVLRLLDLLRNPEPGLSTWVKMYAHEMEWLSAFWNAVEEKDPLLKHRNDFRPGVCPQCNRPACDCLPPHYDFDKPKCGFTGCPLHRKFEAFACDICDGRLIDGYCINPACQRNPTDSVPPFGPCAVCGKPRGYPAEKEIRCPDCIPAHEVPFAYQPDKKVVEKFIVRIETDETPDYCGCRMCRDERQALWSAIIHAQITNRLKGTNPFHVSHGHKLTICIWANEQPHPA